MGFVALYIILSSVQFLVIVRALTLHLISWPISRHNTQPALCQKLGTVLDLFSVHPNQKSDFSPIFFKLRFLIVCELS